MSSARRTLRALERKTSSIFRGVRHDLPGEEEAVINQYEIIAELEREVPKLYRGVRKEMESLKEFETTVENSMTNFSSFNQTSFVQSKIDPSMGSVIEEMAIFQKNLQRISSILGRALEEDYITPLKDFSRTQYPKAKDSKNKWSQSRQAFNNASTKLENAKEKNLDTTQLETDCETARENFKQADQETNEFLQTTLESSADQLVQKSLDFLNNFQFFFQTGLDSVKESIDKIEGIRSNTRSLRNQSEAIQIRETKTGSVSSEDLTSSYGSTSKSTPPESKHFSSTRFNLHSSMEFENDHLTKPKTSVRSPYDRIPTFQDSPRTTSPLSSTPPEKTVKPKKPPEAHYGSIPKFDKPSSPHSSPPPPRPVKSPPPRPANAPQQVQKPSEMQEPPNPRSLPPEIQQLIASNSSNTRQEHYTEIPFASSKRNLRDD